MAVEAKTCRAREVALASFEGALKRDPDQIVALAHPEDYMDDIVAIGEFRGKDAVRDFFRELFAAMPDFDLAVEHVVADESTGHRRGPHGDQDHRAERPVQHQQSERGVAAGDEHEDHRVIKPAHAAARAQRSPVNAVIKRAGAEQCGDTQRIDRHRETSAHGPRLEYQAGTRGQRRCERPLMKHPALFCGRGIITLHGAHLRSAGRRSFVGRWSAAGR